MAQASKKEVGTFVRKNGVFFRVWAPFANEVGVSIWGGAARPLTSDGDGYWSGLLHDAEVGEEYHFVIKNGDQTITRNDPRALYVPTSAGDAVIAAQDFDWEDDDFVAPPPEQQVIYELHVGSFNRSDPAVAGTFAEAAEKLDYLAALGVNMIELMPVNSMSKDRGWGYSPDYIYAVESLYGGRQGLLEFVKAAHQRGIGVIADVVYNHFAPDSANLSLWRFDGWYENDGGGIYFYNDWRAATPWGARPDYGRPEVQSYILDNVRMWIHDCRLDGVRVDSTIFIRNVYGNNDDPGNDLPAGWELLQQISGIARKINPAALTIAEDIGWNDYLTKPAGEGGAGFAAQWEITFPQAMRDALWSSAPANINLAGVAGMLGKRYNNDAWQRIIFVDSHDSADRMARLNESLAPGSGSTLFARKQMLLAAALLLTTPGRPMLLQGQEFMQSGHFSDWDTLDWENAERFAGIVEAHKHLIDLRKNAHGNTAGLTGANINLSKLDDTNKVMVYHRWMNGGAGDDTVVVINFSDRQFDNYVLYFPRSGAWRVRFNSTWQGYSKDFKDISVPDATAADTGEAAIVLPPGCALIFSQDA